jgi:S1-C subfamily serine protease
MAAFYFGTNIRSHNSKFGNKHQNPRYQGSIENMSNKALYQLSARQILVLTFLTALLTAGILLAVGSVRDFGDWRHASGFSFSDEKVAGISDPDKVPDEQNSIEVYKALAPGVAYITTVSRFETFFGDEVEQESGNGSGSVIDEKGHILTNYHVVEGASKLTVSFGTDKVFPATLVGGDPDTDLAVIKIDPPKEGLRIVPFGDSDSLVVGQKVLAIGNPFGLDRTLTTGVISGLQRPIRARNNRPIDAAIQTDASINPGNSGGPLLDKFGRMIGINSQILSRSGGSVGVGFAIPVNTAKKIVPQLIENGYVIRPRIGASLPSVKDLIAQGYQLPSDHGLVVVEVVPRGPADQAGIRGLTPDRRLGDIILSVDGQKMDSLDDLYRLLDRKKIGEVVDVEILRSGEKRTVKVKLSEVPQARVR